MFIFKAIDWILRNTLRVLGIIVVGFITLFIIVLVSSNSHAQSRNYDDLKSALESAITQHPAFQIDLEQAELRQKLEMGLIPEHQIESTKRYVKRLCMSIANKPLDQCNDKVLFGKTKSLKSSNSYNSNQRPIDDNKQQNDFDMIFDEYMKNSK